MERQNGLENPEDRRSALWHGNQYVCERHPQVSGSALRSAQVVLSAEFRAVTAHARNTAFVSA
jgi:hypothetical protein